MRRTWSPDDGLTVAQTSPVVGFEMDLVGPGDGESAVLSTCGETIEYAASTQRSVLSSGPTCAETDIVTEETANSVYQTLTPGASNYFLQTF